MDNLNRNRLIGGGVILLAAALFLPGILQPQAKQLDNPDLAIHLNKDTTLAKRKADEMPETLLADDQGGIVLESADNVVADNAKAKSAQGGNLLKIALESSPEPTSQPVKPQAKADDTKQSQQHLSSWLQIDGFNNDRAALAAANRIEDKRLPTQIKVLSIDGKESRQVLVGPFNSSKKIQTALKTLKTLGYQAKLQR